MANGSSGFLSKIPPSTVLVGPPLPATTLSNGLEAAYISYESTSLASLSSNESNSPLPSSFGLSISVILESLAGGSVSC